MPKANHCIALLYLKKGMLYLITSIKNKYGKKNYIYDGLMSDNGIINFNLCIM